MSVSLRKWSGGESYQVNVKFTRADGTRVHVRKKSPVQTRRGAEEFERQLRNSLLDGSYGKAPKVIKEAPTFKAFSVDFLKTSKANNKYSQWVTNTQIVDTHLLPTFGNLRLDQIEVVAIEKWKTGLLGSGLKKKTVKNIVAVLKRVFSLAIEWGVIDKAPRIKQVRAPLPEIVYLEDDEVPRLLEKLDGTWRTMALVALRTGLRVGELTAMKWDWLDLKKGLLCVKATRWQGHEDLPKGGRTRNLPLSDDAREALQAHRHLNTYVFCRPDGKPVTAHQFDYFLDKASARAGLTKVATPHVLRHTFGTQLSTLGVPIRTIQELMGHASIQMTMRYAHVAPNSMTDAVKLLDTKTAPTTQPTGTTHATSP